MKVFNVKEGTVATYTATIKDEAGTVIPASALTTLTLTYYAADLADDVAGIINSRSAQNVLNANNVTVTTGGVLTWTLQATDTVIVTSTRTTEMHLALFTWTWGTPVKTGKHLVGIRVENLRRST